MVPLLMSHYVMLERALLYTAVTRACKVLVLVGQERAIKRAVESAHGVRRHTMLGHLLRTHEMA